MSRRLVFDGRKRVGFLRSSVDRFVKTNQERVARGARFSQLTEEQRQDIIDRARRLASAGGGQSEISRRLAKRAGRSVETIRSTIRQFDKQHPELAIFPDLNGPLTEAQKTRIYQAFQAWCVGRQADEAVRPHEDDDLSRHQRSARRADHGAAARLHSETRGLPARVRRRPAWARCPVAIRRPEKARRPAGLPPYLASLYEMPLLTREQEAHLFRKYNFLKYKAAKLRRELDPAQPKSSLMDEIESLYQQAVDDQERNRSGQFAARGFDREAPRDAGSEFL